VEAFENFFFLAFTQLEKASEQKAAKLHTSRAEVREYISRAEDQALLLIEVYERHYSFDWMHETMNMTVRTNTGWPHSEHYTIAHYCVKSQFYRVLHDVCFDRYGFDPDFY